MNYDDTFMVNGRQNFSIKSYLDLLNSVCRVDEDRHSRGADDEGRHEYRVGDQETATLLQIIARLGYLENELSERRRLCMELFSVLLLPCQNLGRLRPGQRTERGNSN